MSAQGHRILVADDDEDIRDLVTFKLETASHTVRPVGDGDTALAAIREWKPDLAILDVMMPGLSGLEVLRAVRSDESLSGTRVLLLTARANDSEVDKAYEAGADAYVIKPFSPRELVKKVDELLPH